MIERDYSFLLNRPEHEFDERAIDRALLAKRILITGAGGSIGSALAMRISKSNAHELFIVGRSELPVFNLLADLRHPGCNVSVIPFIGGAGSDQLAKKIEEWRPDIVIHAAAHKHVGLMEAQPEEAFRNNTEATQSLALACDMAGVERFIFISTDKAVNPSSNMGASKRLAEAWLLSRKLRMGVTVCRFGNVLGSSGSLVEILEKDRAAGRPFLMTSEAMTRYFITAREAVGLVLTSGLVFGDGMFTLDMGSPIPIADIATKLSVPGQKIEWLGAGRGEKMGEEIIGGREVRSETEHPGIFWLTPTLDARTADETIAGVRINPELLKSAASFQ